MSLILSGTNGLSDVDGTAATPAIRGTDTNTGIFFPAADTIAFAEGGAEVARFDSSGNLGIGASSPGAKLDVYSTSSEIARIQGGSAGAGYLRFADTTNANIAYVGRNNTSDLYIWQQAAGGSIRFGTVNSQVAQFDSSGNLGLGVTPNAWNSLSRVVQFGSNGTASFENYAGLTNNMYYNGYRDSSNVARYVSTDRAARFSTSTNGGFTWEMAPSGTAGNAISFTQAMTLDASGNLGVGTSAPSQKLHVAGAGSTYTRVSSTNAATGAGAYYQNATSTWLIGAGPASGGSEFAFVDQTSGSNERMRITSGGSLLVGTTSGTGGARLVVNNPNNVSGDFCVVSSLGSNCNNTSSYHYIAVTGAADKFYVYGNGNVVNTNGSYGTLSDAKLKENIVDATPKLADVMRLQVRNFNLKTDPSLKQIGFVAQEFEQVFPGMVDESPDRNADNETLETTTKHIKTSVLIPILVKAIQEQQAIITALTARITALEAK
jgi:hypothetical protein